MELKLNRLSLLIAPLLYAISGFYWLNGGQYSVTCGSYIIIGSFFWIFALDGLFALLKENSPRYAVLGKAIAIYGCVVGGICFGLQGVFAEMFNISHPNMLKALAQHPVAANVIFWIAGPAFPISIFLLGVMLTVKKTIPVWCGTLLAVGGLLFPVSRILRIEWVGHLVDVMMLAPLWWVAFYKYNAPVKALNGR